MPKVKSGERRSEYMSRCVPIVMKEGLKQDAAVGKCEGMFDQSKKKASASAPTKDGYEILFFDENDKH